MPNAYILEIYYMPDEFSKLFNAALQVHGLKLDRWGARRRASLMSDTEVMTILVLFPTLGCQTLEHYPLTKRTSTAISAEHCLRYSTVLIVVIPSCSQMDGIFLKSLPSLFKRLSSVRIWTLLHP